jgi:hypothetical protein
MAGSTTGVGGMNNEGKRTRSKSGAVINANCLECALAFIIGCPQTD